jgi:hypothetical protein
MTKDADGCLLLGDDIEHSRLHVCLSEVGFDHADRLSIAPISWLRTQTLSLWDGHPELSNVGPAT